MGTLAGTTLALLIALWTATAALAAAPSYRLAVDGLACPFCAYGIEKKLISLEGVETVEIDLESGSVVVTMRDDAALDEATAKQAVKDAGFTLHGFEQVSSGSRH